MNWSSVDLNLLRVFDAMMMELSTVRAGERIGLSQPAVSSALGRLRHLVGDELFVREGNRMVPTSRAVELQDPVRNALRQIEAALCSASAFDPATSERDFVILGSDYFSTLLMPRLAMRLTREAPAATIQMLDYPSSSVIPLLVEGKIDLAVDRNLDAPEWIVRDTLFSSYIHCVARKGHPVLAARGIAPGERVPPDIFCAIPQVLMSMDGGKTGTIDLELKERGLHRRVAMTVPHFQAVALATESSDLLGNLPVHFARQAAQSLDIELYLPPFDPPVIGVSMYWHRRVDRDPANRWLRRQVELALMLDDDPVFGDVAPPHGAGRAAE
ncbi:LysR family transcriptional regulator [Oricola cellulosilytica]|uniref:LysR family transcriptional regulator n=1 Tax=Oricola cellulosilytica TaxID=1429082 RepID=A0A4R0PD46_9HYPH|nr:LysR family transcriptional regulator [Oricola cellulosilytica]TCD14463.1 LysR family transcriptional regulator [Oricola cellulosilytica]